MKKETIANLSPLGDEIVELIRRTLNGEKLAPVDEIFEVVNSHHHGHIQAVRMAMKQLGVYNLIASQRSRERDLVVAMVTARILRPESKLTTTRWWHTTTLAAECGVTDATEDELYQAMD